MTIKHVFALVVIALGIAANLELQQAIAEAHGIDWELKQLHDPSPALLARERRGQVTIFDGLPSNEVERAMDQQFGRIGNVMFIRTQYRDPGNAPIYEDDCD